MKPGAYEIARQPGGANHGFLVNYRELPDHLIRKAIRSIQQQIEKHRVWIDDPARKLGDLALFPQDQVMDYTQRKWPADIRRQQAQIDVLTGILEERKHAG